MKLIEAIITVQQVYGIYGDWQAINVGAGFVGRGPRGMYFAYDHTDRLISQSDRLETVISDFAEKYPHTMLDDKWKVSRWV